MDGKDLAARLDLLQEQIDQLYGFNGRQNLLKQREQLKMSEPSTYIDPKTGHLMVKQNQGRPA
jgi:hypothetical protein